jgi:SAM-dependent methyltransferase
MLFSETTEAPSFMTIIPSEAQAFCELLLTPVPIPSPMDDQTARDIDTIWRTIASAPWRGAQPVHIPGTPLDRKQFWGAYASDHKPDLLPLLKTFALSHDGHGKTAIDLGSGNSAAVPLLLAKGYRVIAVDYSRPSLDVLIQNNRAALDSHQLTIVEEDITTYTPFESVDLVIAAEIFSFIDPTQFRVTWMKVSKYIKTNGHLIGTFFRFPPEIDTPSPHATKALTLLNMIQEMGVWVLPDRRMVRPLLQAAHYETETCIYRRDDPNLEPVCIQFIAKKLSPS